MKRVLKAHHLSLAVLALAGVIVAANRGDAQGRPTSRTAIKVGLVDLGVVFNDYYRKADLEQEINKVKKKFEDDYKKQRNRIKSLNKDAEEATGDNLWRLQDQIQLEIQKSRIMRKRSDEQLRGELVKMTLTLLDEINASISTYGKEQGYTMIFKVDNKGAAAEGREEFREKIFRAQVQSVLFYDKAIDLTDTISKLLNSKKKK